jgi:hypothetical protein
VAAARKLDPAALDRLGVEFRETADVPPLAEAMVAIEQLHDRLVELDKAGWKTPPDDPDTDAAHEALLLKEQFTELERSQTAARTQLGRISAGCQQCHRTFRDVPLREPPGTKPR